MFEELEEQAKQLQKQIEFAKDREKILGFKTQIQDLKLIYLQVSKMSFEIEEYFIKNL
jgi:hypothetical protein